MEKVNAYKVLNERAYEIYCETDPCQLYIDTDGNYYLKGAVECGPYTIDEINQVLIGLWED